MSEPINYQQAMTLNYFNLQPASVKGRANVNVEYHKRYLYQKVYSAFEFDLPEKWAMNWFRFWLLRCGSIAVVYTHKYGWIAQPYSIEGLDYQLNPKEIMVYNSYLPSEVHGVVGINCGLIHAFDDYYGLDDLVTDYAVKLSQIDRDLNISLMNANVAYYTEAESKKAAMDIKYAYSEATKGNPFVVLNKNVLKGAKPNTLLAKPKDVFIGGDLLEVRRGIINAFLTDIGIRNVSVQKKERLTSGETQENNDETKAIVSVMYDNIKFDMDMINRVSDLNLTVRLRYDYSKDVSRETYGLNVSRET